MKPINDHIRDEYGGNKAEFSRSVGVKPTATQVWVKNGFFVTCEGFIINPKNTKRDNRCKSK